MQNNYRCTTMAYLETFLNRDEVLIGKFYIFAEKAAFYSYHFYIISAFIVLDFTNNKCNDNLLMINIDIQYGFQYARFTDIMS